MALGWPTRFNAVTSIGWINQYNVSRVARHHQVFLGFWSAPQLQGWKKLLKDYIGLNLDLAVQSNGIDYAHARSLGERHRSGYL
jgi:hypothetical protein